MGPPRSFTFSRAQLDLLAGEEFQASLPSESELAIRIMFEVGQAAGGSGYAPIAFGTAERALIASLQEFAAASSTYVDQAAIATDLVKQLQQQL